MILLLTLAGCVLLDPSDLDARLDADGDGVPYPTDCAPDDATIHPGTLESCDGVDQDCDGVIDNDAVDATGWFPDADGDGYGSEDAVLQCTAPTGYIATPGDCDDADGGIHPGATEITGDGIDEDCDGGELCYDDDDDDGYLDPTADTMESADTDCDDANEGTDTDPTTDCDDADSTIHPDATEITGDSIDEDCDGAETCYDDDDDDGYLDTSGDTRVSADTDCADASEGASADATTDCDDSSATQYPGAAEICGDGLVNDCSGTAADARSLCGLTDTDLSAADAKLIGEDANDSAGSSVASAGDVNGDGYADLIVGAFKDRDGGYDAGAAYLILGPVTGDVDLSVADAKFIGEDASDTAGLSVASAGDVNGDGYDDLIVGAQQDDDGGSQAGAAYLIFGPVTGDFHLSAADAKLIGEDAADYAGYSVASAGDVNGDGYDDLIVGAHEDDDGGTNAGAAYLVYGCGY